MSGYRWSQHRDTMEGGEPSTMEIAVTGALGVLGQSVVSAVTAGAHRPRSIDIRTGPGVDVQADLRYYDETVRALDGVDAIIHLAAHPKPIADNPGAVYHDNTAIGFNVLRAMGEIGIGKVVVASSINAIGGEFSEIATYDGFPVTFNQRTQARDEYSFSKWILEEQVRYAGRVYGSRHSIVCLRIHAVQSREIQADAYRRSPDRGRRNLWGYSPPTETATALVRAAERPLPGMHFGYLVSTTNALLVDTRELLQQHFPDTACTAEIQGTRGLFDTAFAESELGWKA